jgi:glutamate dehydrogenase/leucine dehydrogenase
MISGKGLSSANPFESTLKTIEDAGRLAGIDKKILEKIEKPDRVLEADIPVKMDSGVVENFHAYRVQHNNARGPYKGGIRYHPAVDIDEVKALALWMSIKTAVAGIPYGGGKGGVVVDPKRLSEKELEQLSRGYVRAFSKHIGPEKDIPAPDVYTNAQIMGWMVDEYRKQTVGDEKYLAAFTGKPIENGGSVGRETSTSEGGVFVLEELLKKLGMREPGKTTVAVQGFGNVGANAAIILYNLGYKIVAVSDSKGGIYSDTGLRPPAILTCKAEGGSVNQCYTEGSVVDFENRKTRKDISNEDILELPVDVLIPAALENQVTAKNAGKIKAKVVLELANGPTTPEADRILSRKGVIVVPDILANAGGVVGSYFEWLQNMREERWDGKKFSEELKKVMVSAFNAVWGKGKTLKTDLRTAAYVLALERIADKMCKA